MSGIDSIIGLIAPHICITCGAEGDVMCESCLSVAGEPLPPSCGGCKALSDDFKTCSSCRSWLKHYSVSAAVPYHGVYERLIRAYKFDLRRPAARPIAQLMFESTMNVPNDSLLCYVPTAPSRVRARGFDHMKLLATEYSKLTGLKREDKILARHSNVRQLGSSRAKRLEQMKEEFYVTNPEKIKGRTILLIDDVLTTGATMSAAAEVLSRAGAKRVYGAVFSRGV